MSLRKNLISLTLFNAAKILKEQEEMQMAPPPAAPEPAAPAAPTVDSSGEPGVPRGRGGDPLTIENMIERFNVIRAGKSFDDPEVFGQLTTLYKGLEDDQKQKLDVLLFNIGKIVQNVSDKDQGTPAPEAPPAPAMPQEPAAAPPAPPAA